MVLRAADPFTAPDAPPSAYRREVRPWRVLHACETAHHVWPVVEGQLAVGIRPSVVTPSGFRVVVEATLPPGDCPRPLSLLGAWHEVRGWRESMLEASASSGAEIVHTHSFATGMAGVRNCPVVVYDLRGFVEELADEQAAAERRSWLGRSFRVAEQFVITRAAAVVVHTSDMRMRAFERAALPDNIFVIPEPTAIEAGELPQAPPDPRREVGFFSDLQARGETVDAELLAVLRTFSMIAAEDMKVSLTLEASPQAAPQVMEVARAMGMAERVRLVSAAEAAAALAEAGVVIARSAAPAIAALLHGRTLLAADVAALRDVTSEGRGCLWYDPRDPQDLGRRALFLARNPNFRAALAQAGREHLRATRSPAAVGRRYDEVYRHAMLRRRAMNGAASGSLLPLHACF